MWNWRLLLATGEGRYAELMERTLYNGILASPGLEGASYLYVNPLQVRSGRYVRASTDTATGAERSRPAWHNCACCPPNVMRLFASLASYLATQTAAGVQVHQYAGAVLDVPVAGGRAVIEMSTGYPWEGAVVLHVDETPAEPWELALRIPAWCRTYTVAINHEPVAAERGADGYVRLARAWQAGDEVDLMLQLEPEWVLPNPRVDAIRGCAAVQRGPLVYCFESHDQPTGVDLLDVQVDRSQPLLDGPLMFSGRKVSVQVAGRMPERAGQDAPYSPLAAGDATAGDGTANDGAASAAAQAVTLTAIPYFAWGNRGMQSMRVWVPVAPSA
jgi:DUF1680 family protein